MGIRMMGRDRGRASHGHGVARARAPCRPRDARASFSQVTAAPSAKQRAGRIGKTIMKQLTVALLISLSGVGAPAMAANLLVNGDFEASSDPAFRGDPARHNPEELFVASLSSCHMLWYLHLCATNKIVVISDGAAAFLEEFFQHP